MSADKVSIDIDGKVEEYAVIPATQGPSGIDISNLITNTGLTVFDQGFVNTASTKSAITFIDGDKGILRYRGYPIEQLASSAEAHADALDSVLVLIVAGEGASEFQKNVDCILKDEGIQWAPPL